MSLYQSLPLFVSCANLAQILCAFVKKWQDDIQSEFCTTGAWSVMWILPKLCHTNDAYYQGFPVSDFTYFEIQNPLKRSIHCESQQTRTHGSKIRFETKQVLILNESVNRLNKLQSRGFQFMKLERNIFRGTWIFGPTKNWHNLTVVTASSFHTSQIIYRGRSEMLCS